MDLYSAIIEKGGRTLEDGSAFRQIFTDNKIIQQYANKQGNFITRIFDRAGTQMIGELSKTIKDDGSYLTKFIDFTKSSMQIFAVQKLESEGSFISALFKNVKQPTKGYINAQGELLNVVGTKFQDNIVQSVAHRGEIKNNPVNGLTMPKNFVDNATYTRSNIFNSKFGRLF